MAHIITPHDIQKELENIQKVYFNTKVLDSIRAGTEDTMLERSRLGCLEKFEDQGWLFKNYDETHICVDLESSLKNVG